VVECVLNTCEALGCSPAPKPKTIHDEENVKILNKVKVHKSAAPSYIGAQNKRKTSIDLGFM
jgi:hypothetical protein